jgi:hypothetical protein
MATSEKAQGFLLRPPVPLDEIPELLRSWDRSWAALAA